MSPSHEEAMPYLSTPIPLTYTGCSAFLLSTLRAPRLYLRGVKYVILTGEHFGQPPLDQLQRLTRLQTVEAHYRSSYTVQDKGSLVLSTEEKTNLLESFKNDRAAALALPTSCTTG